MYETGLTAAACGVKATKDVLKVVEENPELLKGKKLIDALQEFVPLERTSITTKTGFELTGHAQRQLTERFAGKLSLDRLDELMHAQNAIRIIDKRTGNINIYVQCELSSGSLTRITVPMDGKRIVSIGFEPLRRIENFISKGDFIPLK